MATCVPQEKEIQTNMCNFIITQLPLDREQALNKLTQHINTVLRTYEQNYHQNVAHFYIGKSSVRHSESFDSNNPNTWNKTRIHSRWRAHETNGFTTMVVIAVVTNDTLPKGAENAQEYCLSLEGELIRRFQYNNMVMDSRITNSTSDAGRKAEAVAYVLYIAMELERTIPQPHGGAIQSKRKNCGTCAPDMPKHGGPDTDNTDRDLQQNVSKMKIQESPMSIKAPKQNVTDSKCTPISGSTSSKSAVLTDTKIISEEMREYKCAPYYQSKSATVTLTPQKSHNADQIWTKKAAILSNPHSITEIGSNSIQHAKMTEVNRRSITNLSAIELLKIIENKQKKNIEDLVLWFDGLQFDEQHRVMELLQKHKSGLYSQLITRSRTRRKT